MRGYSIGIQNGFMSPNCVRELEDMNPIEDGDVFMVNGNMKSLKNVMSGGEEIEQG
jgi:hypothetical protein